MFFRSFRLVCWLGACLLFSSANVFAQNGIEVRDAWIRVAPPGAPLAGYFTLTNNRDAVVSLIGVEVRGFKRAMMHRSFEEGGLMKMAHIDAVEVGAQESVVFAPGGFHLMLMKPVAPLSIGDEVTIRLQFDDGSSQEVVFIVAEGGGH